MSLPRQPAGALRADDRGKRVRLQGWVGRRRDLGDLIFLTLRDRSGTVQVLFEPGAPIALVDPQSGWLLTGL